MSFRESFYQTKQLLVNRLHDFGILSANMNMGWTTLLTLEQNTRITIDVPLNLIYSDEFLITGTLETSTYSRLNGKTVKLKVGNTVVDTTTTNVNGEYSFTHTPVSTGTHSFQVIFEGTNVHTASESSIVTREVGKETSVMNLDAVSTQHYGDTLITGGQLLDNDGQYIADASVVYKLDGTTVNTLTTDSYGTFSVTRTINSFAITRMTFEYAGDSNYTNTSANVDVNVYQPQLSLTSDKNILSHADNDSATLTVQVQDNAPVPQNLAISNHLVTLLGYDDYSGETASDFTDTNNIASISDDNQTIVMYSNSSTSDSNIVHNTTFGSKPMLMSFNVDSATISDAGYIAVFNDAGTSMISYLELSTGQYNIYSYNDTDAVVVTKNGSTLGTLRLNGPLSYKIGFYLSETRIVLSDVQVHEIIGSGYTNSSGACTLTYDSQGIGDIVLTAQANINSSLVSKTYEICDKYYYNTGTLNRASHFDTTNYWVLTNSSKGTVNVSIEGDYYKIQGSGNGNYAFVTITPLLNLHKPFKLRATVKDMRYCGLNCENTNVVFSQVRPDLKYRIVTCTTGKYDNFNIRTQPTVPNKEDYILEMIFNGTSVINNLYDSSENLVSTYSLTMPSNLNNSTNDVRYGVHIDVNNYIMLKDITVDLL